MTAIPVTVVIGGAVVEGSMPALLFAGTVVAPISPYVRRVAERIEREPSGTRIVFERAGRTFSVVVGSPVARSGAAAETLPIAPYLRSGETIIPLAAVARGLGANVTYDAASRTLDIAFEPVPIATMTPYVPATAPPQAPVTFAPTSTPAPAVTITGIPKPRRTPVLIDDPAR